MTESHSAGGNRPSWKRDFYCGAVIAAFSVINIVYAWVTRPTSSAARKTTFLAKTEVWLIFWMLALLVLAAALMRRAWRNRDTAAGKARVNIIWGPLVVVTTVLMGLYFLGMSYVGFNVATFLFLFSTMLLFSWGMDKLTAETWKRESVKLAAISLAFSAGIYVLFAVVLRQMLPRGWLF
ncbi:membrane hypothetical protein [uncultured delta proteobacterium]|uniref:DUF1468 domain-containing protein n=1 Tax=uncultured delta proteobacterium TaxID=34034 RepID=A0A212KA48_9DELT|nr:membrane hypothetical protein [uncultured delta proteobacterium]